MVLEEGSRLLASTEGDAHHFFGFHDLCPWDVRDERVLLHEVTAAAGGPGSQPARVCVWWPDRGRIETFGQTDTWNWQQGSRLQWHPTREDVAVYNDLRGGEPRGVLHDVRTREEEVLPFTIYDMAPEGTFALSPHFGRLDRYWSSYGYSGAGGAGLDTRVPADDGIWRVELQENRADLLVSIRAAADAAGLSDGEKRHPHFVTHPTMNPSGTRFCFFLRFTAPDRGLYSRLLVADADGDGLHVLAEGRVSHFDWYDDDTLLIWRRARPGPLPKLRRSGVTGLPGIRGLISILRRLSPEVKSMATGEAYWLTPVDDPSRSRAVGRGVLREDGHPMFSPSRKWMVTDSYPGRDRYQSLVLYNLEESRRLEFGRFFSPPDFAGGDVKCDLHPRWNRAADTICVDSPHSGRRQVYLIDVSAVLESPKP